MIIGPAVVAIGLYQKVINVELPASTWVLIGVSTFIVGQVLAFRSLWRKTKTMADINTIATQIITVENYGYEFQKQDDCVKLRLDPTIHAIPGVRVEDIKVEIMGKLYETDWEPMKEAISGDIGHFIYTKLPVSLKDGDYGAVIIAYINNKAWPSKSFPLQYRP